MLDISTLFKSFLGANTARGFVSRFADCYSADDGWRAYIIKGGPGTGKSSMMKQLAAIFAERGSEVELCPCSSDPDSLDAVIIHDKRTVIMDGTSPHTVDPAYPGVCETIVNLSDCWNSEAFRGKESKIIALTRQNKRLHAEASRYIGAAGELMCENRKIALSALNAQKADDFAKKLAKRTVEKGERAHEEIRFLSGITPKGLIFLKSSINLYRTVIVVEDEYGAVSNHILHKIREYALSVGQRVISCYNTVEPTCIDHILIPSQSLCFCSENRHTHPDGVTRRIHARRFYDMSALSARRESMRFNRRAADELLSEAVSVIANAKRVHDELEAYYIDAMDFKRVGALTAKIAESI